MPALSIIFYDIHTHSPLYNTYIIPLYNIAHNYDGDMLTDEVAQVHRSPGFITSNLVGKRADGTMIKEFEASHGTLSLVCAYIYML